MLCLTFVLVFCRAPRFKGFQQQDSHELLRHLLDGMKAEEVKVSEIYAACLFVPQTDYFTIMFKLNYFKERIVFLLILSGFHGG